MAGGRYLTDRKKRKLIKKFKKDSRKLAQGLRELIKKRFEQKLEKEALENFLGKKFLKYVKKYFIDDLTDGNIEVIIKKFAEVDLKKELKLNKLLVQVLPEKAEKCSCGGEVDTDKAMCKNCGKPHYYTMIKESL